MSLSTIRCAHRRLHYKGVPLIMGILNVTPDSFSDGGSYRTPTSAVQRALRMQEEGADLIDVGGESTRPGAAAVSLKEELSRVLPVIRRLARKVSIPLSIDTSKAEVARCAIDAGADLVNDVTALEGDPRMAEVVAEFKAGVVLMHMRGRPRTMQRRPRYKDVVADIRAYLKGRAEAAVKQGIRREAIVLDPGIGFGKTPTHNLELVRHLKRFCDTGFPVLLGASRKSFIGTVLDAPVEERLPGSLACVAAAVSAGVQMVRVHDVKETSHFVKMVRALKG